MSSILSQRPCYHEFYADVNRPRPHYAWLWETIQNSGLRDLSLKAQEAHLALHTEGVIFTVYSQKEQGLERVWPFDVIPRIIPAQEWRVISKGLVQRTKALNLFLKDLYHDQKILKGRGHSLGTYLRGKRFPA